MNFKNYKTHILVFAAALMLFSGFEADARGSRSSSRSFSSSSSSSSSSWGRSSKPSKPSPTRSLWGSSPKKATPTKSLTTSKKSNGSSWGSTTKSKATPTKSDRAKAMASKKKVQSQKRYAATKASVAKTSPKDWKASKSSFAAKNNYKPRTNVSYGRRYSPEQRRVYRDRYNNSYNGYYYNDPYDHSMIWGFSSLWWFHHWNSVDRAHYANDARMRQIEMEVAAMRAKGITTNANYMDPGMTGTTAYSTGYMNGVKNDKIKPKDDGLSALNIFLLLMLAFAIITLIVFLLLRNNDSGGVPYNNNNYDYDDD